MAEFPAMPLWTDAYLADTTHLTTLEHGAYMLLLMAMWRAPGQRLPAEDVKLARFARLTIGQWRRIAPTLMEFFVVEDGFMRQGRLTDEAEAVRQRSTKQSDKAKARWRKNNDSADATATPEACRSDASHIHIHKEEREDSYTESKSLPASANNARARRGPDHGVTWPVPEGPQPWAALEAEQRGLPSAEVPEVWDRWRNQRLARGITPFDPIADWRAWCVDEVRRRRQQANAPPQRRTKPAEPPKDRIMDF